MVGRYPLNVHPAKLESSNQPPCTTNRPRSLEKFYHSALDSFGIARFCRGTLAGGRLALDTSKGYPYKTFRLMR
jgi:hypothetical protein